MVVSGRKSAFQSAVLPASSTPRMPLPTAPVAEHPPGVASTPHPSLNWNFSALRMMYNPSAVMPFLHPSYFANPPVSWLLPPVYRSQQQQQQQHQLQQQQQQQQQHICLPGCVQCASGIPEFRRSAELKARKDIFHSSI